MSEFVGAVLTRPDVDVAAASGVLAERFGIAAELRPLPSERDRNFAVAVDGTDRYVLKLSNASEDRAFLEMQHDAMRRLAAAGVPCQVPVPSVDGREVIDAGGPDRAMLVRLLTWLPGRPLATIPPADRDDALLADLGRTMARTVRALDGWDHPAAHRSFQWAAEESVGVISTHAPAVTDPQRVELLSGWQTRLASLADRLPELPHGIIHNDANDHNVLVADDARSISGLLDLGDSIWSVRLNELAVAAAYAALDAPDPVVVIGAVARGWNEVVPLADADAEILPELVALRLATSVSLSAHQAMLDPDDPYLTISERPAWALLERLAAIDRDEIVRSLRR
jgi:Ser/Thr protein kinase RdoA (MazF antagonist)